MSDRFAGLGHGPAGPVGDLSRRFGASQRHYLGHPRQRHRRLARLAASVAKEPLDTALGVMPLPAPHRRTADLGPARHFRGCPPLGRVEHNLRTLHVLEGARLRSPMIAASRAQSSAQTITETVWLMRHDRTARPICESYDWFNALGRYLPNGDRAACLSQYACSRCRRPTQMKIGTAASWVTTQNVIA